MTSAPAGAPHSISEFIQAYENARTLRGFRCARCGALTATWGVACFRCGAPDREEATLTETGTVVAGTLVTVPAEEFVNDAPYAYVLVELDGGGRISGWIPGVRSDEQFRPGTRVRFRPSYKPGVQFERTSLGD